MDIYAYLKRENEKLFDRVETIRELHDHALQKLLVNDLRLHLPAYLDAKAATLYDALCSVDATLAGILNEQRREIAGAFDAMDGAYDMDDWLERFDVLRLAVLRHLDDEEHAVFQAARRRLNPDQAADLLHRLTDGINTAVVRAPKISRRGC